jgi:hypothetical protein
VATLPMSGVKVSRVQISQPDRRFSLHVRDSEHLLMRYLAPNRRFTATTTATRRADCNARLVTCFWLISARRLYVSPWVSFRPMIATRRTCSDCGRELEDLAEPCAACGSTRQTAHIGLSETAIAVEGTVSMGAIFGPDRPWYEQWHDVRKHLEQVEFACTA